MLSDSNLETALAYGVAMKGQDIALPAVFVITRGGQIAWSAIGESITDRSSLADIVAQLDRLSS